MNSGRCGMTTETGDISDWRSAAMRTLTKCIDVILFRTLAMVVFGVQSSLELTITLYK